MNLKACSSSLTTLGLSSSCSLHSERASWGCSASLRPPHAALPWPATPQGCPCPANVFKLFPFPSLEGARAPLQGWAAQAGGMCIPDSQEKTGSCLWAGRRAAPSELSSTFPFLSPAPSAPSMGPHFPLDTRPYSSPRGLRLPTHLCTDTSIPLGVAELASAQGWVSHPQPIPAPTPLPGPGHCREICFHRLNLFTSLIAPQNPATLQALQHSSCFTLGVGAAEICSFWPLQNFLEVFNIIWWDVTSVEPEGTQAMELAACLPRWLGGAWAALGGRWDTGHSSVVRRGFCYTFSCL